MTTSILPIHPFPMRPERHLYPVYPIVTDDTKDLLFIENSSKVWLDGKVETTAPIRFPIDLKLTDVTNMPLLVSTFHDKVLCLDPGTRLETLYIEKGGEINRYDVSDVHGRTLDLLSTVINFDYQSLSLVAEPCNTENFDWKNPPLFEISFKGTLDYKTGEIQFKDFESSDPTAKLIAMTFATSAVDITKAN